MKYYMCYQTGHLFGSVFTSHYSANLIYFIIFHSIILSTTIETIKPKQEESTATMVYTYFQPIDTDYLVFEGVFEQQQTQHTDGMTSYVSNLLFSQPVRKLIIATGADYQTHPLSRTLTDALNKMSDLTVELWAWQDLCDRNFFRMRTEFDGDNQFELQFLDHFF